MQTAPIAPGDASIIEAKWKYPGTYLFHSHGLQEERGNMGQIEVVGEGEGEGIVASTESQSNNNNASSASLLSAATQSGNGSQPLTKSVSMFDWQFDLQKKLQKPQVINYSQGGDTLEGQNANNDTKEIQQGGENMSLSLDKRLATNLSGENNTDADTALSGGDNKRQWQKK